MLKKNTHFSVQMLVFSTQKYNKQVYFFVFVYQRIILLLLINLAKNFVYEYVDSK